MAKVHLLGMVSIDCNPQLVVADCQGRYELPQKGVVDILTPFLEQLNSIATLRKVCITHRPTHSSEP